MLVILAIQPDKVVFRGGIFGCLKEELAKHGENGTYWVRRRPSIKKSGLYQEITEILKECGKNVCRGFVGYANPTGKNFYEGIKTPVRTIRILFLPCCYHKS